MKIFKRMGALLAALTIMASCMVPSAFAGNTDLRREFTQRTTQDITTDINDVNVQAGVDKTDGKFKVQIDGITDVANSAQSSIWDKIFTQYRGVIVGLSGIGAITMIVFFIMNFMKLGASAGNPQARTQALVGIIWTGLAAAGLGGVTLFVGFFYNVLKN